MCVVLWFWGVFLWVFLGFRGVFVGWGGGGGCFCWDFLGFCFKSSCLCVSYRKSFPKTCPQFFCGSARQLIVEGFPCSACQANKHRWATGAEARQTYLVEEEISSKTLSLHEQPPFSRQVGEERGVYAGRRRDERLQRGMGKVLCNWCWPAPSPCTAPKRRGGHLRWGHLRWGRMQTWPRGAGVHRKGIAGGTWARRWCFERGRGLGRALAGSSGAQAGCNCVLDRWGTGRRKEACELPTQWRSAGKFGDGGSGPRTVGRQRSVWGASLLQLHTRTRLCLPGPSVLFCKH